jgi:hypothetical protein
MTYDLCGEAWDPEFKQETAEYMVACMLRVHHRLTKIFQGHGGREPAPWSMELHAGCAIAGLVLWGQKGAMPSAPQVADEVETIRAEPHGEGIDRPTAVPLTPGVSPTNWLVACVRPSLTWDGPFAEVVDGNGVPRRAPMSREQRDVRREFRPIDPRFLAGPPKGGIRVQDLVRSQALTAWFLTDISTDAPRIVRVENPGTCSGFPSVFLGPHLMGHGQVVRLDTGIHPMMAILRLRTRWDCFAPRLDEANETDLRLYLADRLRREEEYAIRMQEWKCDVAEWQTGDGMDLLILRLFRVGWWHMLRYSRGVAGDAEVVPASADDRPDIARIKGWLSDNRAPDLFGLYGEAYLRAFGEALLPSGLSREKP